MDVVFTLGTLFFDYDQVIVSGLGVFTTEIEKAYIHPVENSFSPEFKKIKFRADAQAKDGLLAKKLGGDSANELISEFVAKVQTALKEGQKVPLKNIGYLYVHHTGEIILEQDRNFNYVKKNFGLQGFIQDPVKKIVPSNEPVVAEVVEKKKSKSIVLIALWVLAIILAGVAFWQAENISSLFENKNNVAQVSDSVRSTENDNVVVAADVVTDTTNNDKQDKLDTSKVIAKDDSLKQPADSTENAIAELPIEEEVKEPIQKDEITHSIPVDYKGPRYYVIAGCFESKQKAKDLLSDLHEMGYERAFLKGKIGRLHRVSYDVFTKRSDASDYMLQLKREGRKGVWIQKK